LKDEHQDKKKSPLPNEDEWRLIPCQKGTPRQLNGFDCGVFTCMFADFVSNDCPLMFSQEHINQCRERIALSILQGSAIM
jgi:sentrin-specific protease 1